MLEKFFPKYILSKTGRKNFQAYLAKKELIDQYIQYLEMKTHLPVPHQIKQNNILRYQKEHQYSIFVETGTYLGDMVEAQKNHFEQLISIELSEALFEKAVTRFEKYPLIKILQGDSGKVLQEVIRNIQKPALFWLDGHYSSGFTAKTNENTPIMDELDIIFKSPFGHGILVDDARLFTGRDDYPSIPDLCTLVKENAPDRTLEVADDIIRIMPGTSL